MDDVVRVVVAPLPLTTAADGPSSPCVEGMRRG